MSALGRLFIKEWKEAARSWRLPLIGGVALFFALTGPVLALMTPQLIESMQAGQPGIVIRIPDPTWRDAYAQWVKNLSQVVSFIVLIAAAGSVAGEVANGTASLVLSKPVSRAAFVLGKFSSLFALVSVTALAGAGLTQLVTLVVFHEAPADHLWQATAVWIASSAVLIALSTLFSCLVSALAAVGLSLGAFAVLSMATLWGPLVRYTPVGLLAAPGALVLGESPGLAVPLATAAVAVLALLGLASWLFTRREL